MFRLDRAIKYIWRRFITGILWWLIPGLLFVLAVRVPWLNITIPYKQAEPQDVIELLAVEVPWLDIKIPDEQVDRAVTKFAVKGSWWETQIPYAKVTELPVKVSWSDIQIPVLWGTIPAAWPVALALWGLLWVVRRGAIWRLATGFVQALYNVPKRAEADKFLNYSISGARFGFGPYLIIKEGKVAFGHDVAKYVGGPGGLVIYNDSAVVLEQAGKLTRVIRGPGFPDTIQPFERVWEVVDLRPQHWPFLVKARTYDGIPVEYVAEVIYKVGKTDDDVFKAAIDTWIRDAWRTEPDRLLTWHRKVVISQVEGITRSILARCTMDQLVDVECRERIRAELEEKLSKSVEDGGIEIRNVTLGDIKLEGQVLDQWFEVWRTERKSELNKVIREGAAKRLRTVTGAKAQVRRDLLDKIVDKFHEVKQTRYEQGEHALSKSIILSFVEVLKRIPLESSLYLPNDMVETMDMMQYKIKHESSAGWDVKNGGDRGGS